MKTWFNSCVGKQQKLLKEIFLDELSCDTMKGEIKKKLKPRGLLSNPPVPLCGLLWSFVLPPPSPLN